LARQRSEAYDVASGAYCNHFCNHRGPLRSRRRWPRRVHLGRRSAAIGQPVGGGRDSGCPSATRRPPVGIVISVRAAAEPVD
jgi:hypothetical protein